MLHASCRLQKLQRLLSSITAGANLQQLSEGFPTYTLTVEPRLQQYVDDGWAALGPSTLMVRVDDK